MLAAGCLYRFALLRPRGPPPPPPYPGAPEDGGVLYAGNPWDTPPKATISDVIFREVEALAISKHSYCVETSGMRGAAALQLADGDDSCVLSVTSDLQRQSSQLPFKNGLLLLTCVRWASPAAGGIPRTISRARILPSNVAEADLKS